MKVAEIKKLTNEELSEQLLLVEKKLVQLKLNHAVSPLANPNEIKAKRRLVARMKTILRERSL